MEDASGDVGEGGIGNTTAVTLLNGNVDPENNNYIYTEIGEFKSDALEGIEEIIWRVDSKISEVKFLFSTGNMKTEYEHDLETPESYHLSERHIYGSSRIGMITEKVEYSYTYSNNAMVDINENEFVVEDRIDVVYTTTLGFRQYELSNHLGNVLSVIGDQKLPIVQSGVVESFEAYVISSQDYSPFGVTLSGRSWSEGYRYGFNGKELDNETLSGAYDFGARILDARLGRWMSVDPEFTLYPSWAPFSFGFADPISNVDNDGAKINWWRFRSTWIIRRAMLKTPKGTEIWNHWRKTAARINLHVTNSVLTRARINANGATVYDIVEGITVPRMPKFGRSTNDEGIRYNPNRSSFKRDRDNNAGPYYSSVDVFISMGTKELEDQAAHRLGSNNFHTLSRTDQAKAIAQEIATGNYTFAEVGPEPSSGTPFDLSDNIAIPLPLGAIVGLNPGGAGGTGVPAPTPNNNETKIEYLNRLGVHEGTHTVNDPFEITSTANNGTGRVWVSPKFQENPENDPCRNESETIKQQR